jgi:ribosome-interacting GTPase 1
MCVRHNHVLGSPLYVGVCHTAQKNKATSYHLGLLKAKLAKLRRELIAPPGGGGSGGAGVGFDVARTGIGIVPVGCPSFDC